MLIALDWGTTTLRAYLIDDAGTVRAARSEPWGILALPDGGFSAALDAISAGWPADAPVLAAGMVGSRGGWHEVPYLRTPSAPAALAAGAVTVPDAPRPVLIVPGLRHVDESGAPDVMRGEETEAIGAAALVGPDALLVMPGTHAKWARVADGAVVGFRTFMTGELHALLLRHSILGRLVPAEARADDHVPPGARDAVFNRGVRAAHADGALPLLFSARALPLLGALDAALIPDYLTGLLLGDELRAGLAAPAPAGVPAEPVPVAVIGTGPLARRTADAFALLGHERPPLLAGTAPAGLARIAVWRGLISGETRSC